jgi:urea transport system permease protein
MAASEVRKFEIWGTAIAAVVILGVFPALNTFVPETNSLHVSNFTINLYGSTSLTRCWRSVWTFFGALPAAQPGSVSFFALGGYAFGMYLMLKIGKLGQHKSELPDFMVFLGYNKLPAHWVPFDSFWFAAAAVILVPGIVALVFGYLAFRSRIRGVYFSILTQALTYGACLMFFRNDFTFGGNNGLTDFKFVLDYDVNSAATQRALYILSGVLLVGAYVFSRWLTTTKFGKVQRAIRDSENRVLFSGYATSNFKLFVFVYAAVISGLAGALYTPQVGIINPSEMSPEKSLEAVVWVAVGGRGTLVGPIIGSVGVNALKSWATRAYPDLWLIILGGLFVLIVLFMPKGIVGIPAQIQGLRKRFRKREPVPAVAPASVTTK